MTFWYYSVTGHTIRKWSCALSKVCCSFVFEWLVIVAVAFPGTYSMKHVLFCFFSFNRPPIQWNHFNCCQTFKYACSYMIETLHINKKTWSLKTVNHCVPCWSQVKTRLAWGHWLWSPSSSLSFFPSVSFCPATASGSMLSDEKHVSYSNWKSQIWPIVSFSIFFSRHWDYCKTFCLKLFGSNNYLLHFKNIHFLILS